MGYDNIMKAAREVAVLMVGGGMPSKGDGASTDTP